MLESESEKSFYDFLHSNPDYSTSSLCDFGQANQSPGKSLCAPKKGLEIPLHKAISVLKAVTDVKVHSNWLLAHGQPMWVSLPVPRSH